MPLRCNTEPLMRFVYGAKCSQFLVDVEKACDECPRTEENNLRPADEGYADRQFALLPAGQSLSQLVLLFRKTDIVQGGLTSSAAPEGERKSKPNSEDTRRPAPKRKSHRVHPTGRTFSHLYPVAQCRQQT